ncbi:hypothetical protein COLO4_30181 [Corchorus olitorius]|uniref:Pentacotripeptide-repeat region of PRORP domain-containing protein n=1 Tax=Corchorus olitorius TaxID=93759 RepID=A0A1R3HAL0_9ROSI|nr:hypothetical protein COLO4_30181 [Corchorus olitorius]
MKHFAGIFRVFSSSLSIRTLSTDSSSNARNTVQLLLQRVGNRKDTLVPVLEGWLQEGKSLTPTILEDLTRTLRGQNHFEQALQVSDWMTQKRNLQLSFTDIYFRMDSISKVNGLEEAEKYFESLPDSMKDKQVYTALLKCYSQFRCLEKAEATLQRMRELGFATEALSYNIMLKLYAKLGKHEMLDHLLQEMQEKGIDSDSFTVHTRFNAYVDASDMEGMQKFMMKMEANPCVSVDWYTYIGAARVYAKAKLHEQAAQMLKRAEELITDEKKRKSYEIFLTLYTDIGSKEDIFCNWELYKDMGNQFYVMTISSLVKLDDLDGAGKIAEEWESRYASVGVPRLMISAYCKRGLLETAETYANRLTQNGKVVDAFTWSRLAIAFKKVDQMEKAVEYMNKTVLAIQQAKSKRNHKSILGCLHYLRKREA